VTFILALFLLMLVVISYMYLIGRITLHFRSIPKVTLAGRWGYITLFVVLAVILTAIFGVAAFLLVMEMIGQRV
jgi:hypothetical protein